MVEIQIVNHPQNVAFSSEMVEIQIVNDPQNVAFSSEMAEIKIVNGPESVAFSSEMIDFEEGFFAHTRVKFTLKFLGCRAVSPIHFFDLILNNAPALRAGKNASLLAIVAVDTEENEPSKVL